MRRINVIGSSGSGKSTFSSALAEALHIPHIEMDALFWQPNWTESDDETFFASLRKATAGEAWVLDGNYSRSVDIKWARADTVIWLDYSFWRTLTQLLRRSFQRAWSGREVWAGTNNRETFGKLFGSRDSILWWMLTTYGPKKRRYQKLFAQNSYDDIQFIHLKSPREAKKFINEIKITVR